MKIFNLIFSFFTLFIVYKLSSISWHVDLGVIQTSPIMIGLQASSLANFFALLVSFSLIMISFASWSYTLSKSFYLLLSLLSISLFVMLYAEDYLLFFIGWEVMSISTYFLLSNNLTQKALHKYILFAMLSALSLLLALMLLYSTSNSFLYADAHDGFILLEQSRQILLGALMVLAFFIKIAVIGTHYWLVDAYEEAHDIFTPYLSAILSKMGIYGLIVFLVYVVDISSLQEDYLSYFLAFIGVASSIIATFKAINEDSIKRVLAYSSIAQLGYIVTVLSLADGMGGALYHSLIHTLVKLLLFINIAGIIFVTGRSKFSTLGGLIYKMPHSFVMLLIGIIVLAGIPPLGGFASKFLIYTTLLDAKYLLILSAMMFASASAFLYIYKLIYGIYLGHTTNKKLESIKEVPFSFLIPQYILSGVLIGISFYPGWLIVYLNTILSEMHLKALSFSNITSITTPHAEYNGFVVMSAFVVVFLVVLLFLLRLKSKTKEAKDRFDIAYCGEEPNIASHLHYGFGMGQELQRVSFIALILKNSSKYFYEYIASQTLSFSDVLKKIYTGKLNINFNLSVIFAIILLWWSLK